MVARIVSPLALIAMTASAALIAARLYLGWQMSLVLLAAAGGAVVLTGLLRALGSPATALLGSLAGLGAGLAGVTAALRPRSTVDGPLAAVLLDALANSGARLMTSTLPIEPAPDTVALPIALTWLAGAAGVLLLTRWPLAALLPSIGLLGAAVVFVGPNAGPAYPLAGLFAVAAAGHLAATRDGRAAAPVAPLPGQARRVEAARRLGAGLAAVAVLGVLAVTLGPAAAAVHRTQPYDPRVLFVPPQKHPEALNPLGMLSGWATDTEQPLLEVRSPRPVRISWAALSRFDGITWLPDDEFRAAGSVLTKVEPMPRRSVAVKQRITVRDLPGGWLPAAEVPREVGGVRASFDAGSRMLAAPDGLRDGLTYTVASEVPVRDPDYLVGAGLPVGPEHERLDELPEPLPDELRKLAEKAAGEGTPYQKALRLEKFLRTKYAFYPGAPSGHGYANLGFFLTSSKADGGGQGTSEQFAAAFAVLGRVVGLPTRVVVGFHAGERVGDDRRLVRSGDAFAWAEVFLLGEGWVPFDPTPGKEGAQPPPEENTPEAEAESKQKDQQLQRPDTSPPPGEKDRQTAPRCPATERGSLAWLVTAGGAGGVLLLAGVVAGLRHRRSRSRLTRGSPAERVVGAWAEVREALRLAGQRAPGSMTAEELAVAHSGGPLPDLRRLAAQANAVGFGFGSVGGSEASVAVTTARDYVKALRRTRRLARRVLWQLDPRPLFWPR
ncbi:MAG: transglutaminase domain-containing protein [Micromonosporaceae bacterium]|nr:transglutaminase domain-containing protein [Micromonosporaceae bacterium]